MLETIREYGTLKLADAGEVVAARDRHADYWRDWLLGSTSTYVAIVSRATSTLFATVRRRVTDLIAMLNWLADQGRLREVFAPVAVLMSPLWIGDGRFDEGADWMRRVATVDPDDPDLRLLHDSSAFWLAIYRGGDSGVLGLFERMQQSADADGLSVPARLSARAPTTTALAGIGGDARPFSDVEVAEARALVDAEPGSELARTPTC